MTVDQRKQEKQSNPLSMPGLRAPGGGVVSTVQGLAEPRAISPCSQACPLGINVQRYVGLAQRGLLVEALASILERCPLPGVCGYLCQRPCEGACRRGQVDRSVAIRWLKKAAAGAVVASGQRLELARGRPPSGWSVAIVGAGPAGLSAAFSLALGGHRVTLFDRREAAGGLLGEVVPDFRLPRRVLRADVERVLDHPLITFRGGVELGRGEPLVTALERFGHYAAILVATGAGHREELRPGWLTLPPQRPEGVMTPLAALRGLEDLAAPAGREAAFVMGGASTSVAVARALRRAGWPTVTLVAGRSYDRWPADPEDLAAASADDVGFLDELLIESIDVVDGRLTGIVGRRARADALGRPVPIEGIEAEHLEAELLVIEALRAPDTCPAEGLPGVARTTTGAVVVDAETLAAPGAPGVFAAGECATGPKTVVEAMAAGKRAAVAIDRYLSGAPLSPIDGAWRRRGWSELAVIGGVGPDDSKHPERLDEAIEIPPSVASREARRCLRCGPCAECDRCDPGCRHERAVLSVEGGPAVVFRAPAGSADGHTVLAAEVDRDRCTACGRCEEACPHQAVVVRFHRGEAARAEVSRPACRGCGRCVPACPFGAIELAPGRSDRPLLWQAMAAQLGAVRGS